MKKKAPSFPWVSRPQAAKLFGVSVRQFDDRHRKMAPPAAVKKINREIFVDFPALLAAYLENLKAECAAAADPLMTGPDDEGGGLSRFRLARAQQEELNLAVMKKELVNVKELAKYMELFVSTLRRCGDQLVREFGNRAADIFNDGVETAGQHVEAMVRAEMERRGERL